MHEFKRKRKIYIIGCALSYIVVFIDGWKGDKPIVPLKLQRYLVTIARRKNIKQIRIAAVITDGSSVVLSAQNTLPAKEVDGKGLEAAMDALAAELAPSGFSVTRYVGFFDSDGEARQYNFEMECGPVRDAFRRVDVESAFRLLSAEEAGVLAAVLDRRRAQTMMCQADVY
jgi:hypothetical protein